MVTEKRQRGKRKNEIAKGIRLNIGRGERSVEEVAGKRGTTHTKISWAALTTTMFACIGRGKKNGLASHQGREVAGKKGLPLSAGGANRKSRTKKNGGPGQKQREGSFKKATLTYS